MTQFNKDLMSPEFSEKVSKDFPLKLEELVLKNLQNQQLSVAWLAKSMYRSERQFHRLVKKHTGKTVNGFIREKRLIQAKRLLESGCYSTSEIAMRVGYRKPSWFSTQFFLRFGKRPKEV